MGEKDLSLKGLEACRSSKAIYLESYTSPFLGSLKDLEELIGKPVILADRKKVEVEADEILDLAKDNDVSFLVVGDIFSATTHLDLLTRAKEKGIHVTTIHNASVLTAVSETGLSLYKFGKTASIPFLTENWTVDTPYDLLKENGDAHTLFLLDLRPDEEKFMSFSQAIQYLLDVEERRKESLFSLETDCVACIALGTENQQIFFGKAKDLLEKESSHFPHALIVPGKLHFMEEEFLKNYSL